MYEPVNNTLQLNWLRIFASPALFLALCHRDRLRADIVTLNTGSAAGIARHYDGRGEPVEDRQARPATSPNYPEAPPDVVRQGTARVAPRQAGHRGPAVRSRRELTGRGREELIPWGTR
ncbi:hypothetical protein GCM10010187_32060 [Actinomadura coerulea]|nr:hypothetical protein GCM10010187_32060 [Actinomadura coerulea]